MMTSANTYTMPVRDYKSASIPQDESALEPRIIKLSQETYKRGKKVFSQSGNLKQVLKMEPQVEKTATKLEDLKEEEKQKIESKARRIEKIITLSVQTISSAKLEEKAKPAKLGSSFISKVHTNERFCRKILEESKKEKTPKEINVQNVVEPSDITINFNPEEIKQRVNSSFENADERIEFTPIKEYKIDIPTEEEKENQESYRLPHAERSAKLNVSTLEDSKENLKDYIKIPEKNANLSIENNNFEMNKADRTSVLSVDEMLRGGRVENMREDSFLTDEYKEERANGNTDDGIEALMLEVAEEQRRAEEAATAAEQARKEREKAEEELRNIQALAKAKQEERERAQREKEQVEKQREETRKAYEATLDATRKKLEAEKTRIMNKAKTYQREYQRATEATNKLWSERVATEEQIDVIDTEIPTIKSQTENDRETMATIRKRTKEIRSMANDVTGVDPIADTTFKVVSQDSEPSKKNTSSKDKIFASIFDGTSPIDYNS